MFAAKVNSPENIGTVELFGTPLAIMIGLKELNVPFLHRPSMPGSRELFEYSPLGTIPVLVHRPNAIYAARERVALFEPLAIARYLDEVLGGSDANNKIQLFPPTVETHDRNHLENALRRVEIDQISSFVMLHVKKTVEDRYVKPFFALRNNGASRQDIDVALDESRGAAETILIQLERIISNTQEQLKLNFAQTEFIFNEISWADVFLFPILRDLKATKSGVLQGGDKEPVPWLTKWLNNFASRPSAVATLSSSFAGST
ncbi:hypothetical protein MYAM1_000726 [Malassezia yamatoensis]|uniref:Glutathione S-transferase n=1 Tax=Malassezia yamatoensis TaxID=253288 RepID=A0AAJ6CG95_9BASI|nr:hypothetical protein MYAM1_000726 [Malassezia yamatoensis]